ncbi:MAG TPA: hypothetical protein VFD87_15475 [Phototrophicaceae bacterium]|jgi:hypothetical protein|nr:hypothetical protein [Phototrophicaceae bacterium]
MQGFSNSFLVFLYQIAFGGLVALAGTPFHEIERAFYKSTAGVLYVIALLELWGESSLFIRGMLQGSAWGNRLEIIFHVIFVLAFSCYMASLWTELPVFRARSFAASILTGLVGLMLSAQRFYDAPFFSLETLVYPSMFLVSALLLGSVTVGMLIGHWYLIDTGQSLDPFIRIYKFFVFSLIAQCILLALFPVLLHFLGMSSTLKAMEQLWRQHSTLLVTRVVVGQCAPLVLSWMIWRTLLIPHTMAATGLFYIALLGVFVGEILGRQIIALTALPF